VIDPPKFLPVKTFSCYWKIFFQKYNIWGGISINQSKHIL